jgi:L-serine deaminase
VLSREKINIATFNVNRSSRGGRAIMVIECDSIVSPEALQHIADSPEILSVAFVDPD